MDPFFYNIIHHDSHY